MCASAAPCKARSTPPGTLKSTTRPGSTHRWQVATSAFEATSADRSQRASDWWSPGPDRLPATCASPGWSSRMARLSAATSRWALSPMPLHLRQRRRPLLQSRWQKPPKSRPKLSPRGRTRRPRASRSASAAYRVLAGFLMAAFLAVATFGGIRPVRSSAVTIHPWAGSGLARHVLGTVT